MTIVRVKTSQIERSEANKAQEGKAKILTPFIRENDYFCHKKPVPIQAPL
jgi:hypothetical protein